jgi:hypothetical protein
VRPAGLRNSALSEAPSAQQSSAGKSECLADDPYQPLSKKQKLNEWLRRTYAVSTFLSAGVDTANSGIANNMRYCRGGNALQGDANGYLLTEFTPDLKRILRRHAPKPLLVLGDRISLAKRNQDD